MNRNRRRKGFTLVELLVVISIIGMLMALLLPAVQSAREAGRSNTCRNNMRNLALAVIQYESARNTYPGYDNDLDQTNAAGTLNGNDSRSWTFVVLPYMDHRAVFDKHKNNNTTNVNITEGLELTICPSNPPETVGGKGTSYVVNSGQLDKAPGSATPADYQGNGVFHYSKGAPTGQQPAKGSGLSMSAAYIAGQDGLGTTLMMSENADAKDWVDTAERWTGFTYHHVDQTPGVASLTPADPMGLNVNFGQSKNGATVDTSAGWARASSFHPNGVNFVFCDGHVRFMSDTIAYGVFQAIMTPRGNAAYNNSSDSKFGNTHSAVQTVDENALN